MRRNTSEKLTAARAAIVRWERKLRFAAGKLQRYRAQEARLVRRQASEIAATVKGAAGTAGRKFDLGTAEADTPKV